MRGSLHFWFRALAAPKLGYDIKALYRHESALFGSTQATRYRLRISNIPSTTMAGLSPARLVPSANFLQDAYSALSAEVTFSPRNAKAQEPDAVRALAATTWTWANLGSIGKRSRRGAGSFLLTEWTDWPSDTPEIGMPDKLPAAPSEGFSDVETLKQHLLTGVTTATEWIGQFFDGFPTTTAMTDPGVFHLAGLAQVYLGGPLPEINPDNSAGAIADIMAQCSSAKNLDEAAYTALLGCAAPRRPSALLIRLTPLADGRLVPVLTWSPPADYHPPPGQTATDPSTLPVVQNLLTALGARRLA